LVEEALQESEERHRLLLEASPDPIVVYDIEGKATYINPAFEQVFGWSSGELLGRLINFVPEESWPETETAIERMLLGERILAFETRRLTKDGRILDIQLSSSLFHDRDGKSAGNIVILRDVTKQRLAAEALRESEENFKALAENANDGILIAVGEGTHVYANSRASEITGYSVAELQEITLHEFTAPDEVEKVSERFRRRLKGENVPDQYETALVRESGEIFPAELSSGSTVWEGQPASIVIFRDITGRKQAEEALRKREAELEIRASELEELNSALRVLLKRREEDQKELEEKVLSNVKELVLPYVERLKKSALGAKQDTYLKILESNLEDIVSPFVRKLSSTYLGLTPMEIHVANLVKEARDTKTIAQLLNMSPRTVESHRQNIRKKLGLKNKKANLRTHLLSI
jgi:PAS domain S-box-containing protein